MTRHLRVLGLAFLFLAACGSDDDPTRHNDFVPLTAITIKSENPKIAVGTSNQFTAIGDFSGAFSREITEEATWSFDGTVLAPADGSSPGLAKALAPGTVEVSARLDGVTGTLDRFPVVTTTTDAVRVTPATAEIALGMEQQFAATGTFTEVGGAGESFTQEITRAPGTTWELSDTSLATINGAGLATGVKAGGPLTVTATFDGVAGTAALTITEAQVESIAITPADQTFATGETVDFKAVATFSDGTTADVTGTADWSSSDIAVVTIDPATGKATTVAAGPANISAEVNGSKGSAALTVGAVTSIAVTPADPAISTGATEQLTATATFANNATRNITSIATWNSDRNGTATVEQGLVTGVAPGTATITATKDVSGSTDVTVR